MKSFLSINEFSKLSGLEISTLRYWDDIGLFSPSMRNPDNNYRYYSSEQIVAVKFINVMSNIGVPLKELAVIKQKQEPKRVFALLAKQSKLINAELRRLQEALSVINERQGFINWGLEVLNGVDAVDGMNAIGTDEVQNMDATKVSVFHKDVASFVCGPRNTWKEGEGFYDAFINFLNCAGELRINLNLPVGGMHENWEHFMESPGAPDYFFSVDINGNKQRVAGNYMLGFARGNYGELGDVHLRMDDYAKQNSLHISGPVYTVYLLDEICYSDPSQFLAQTSVAVSK